MIRLALLLLISGYSFSQTLPKRDKGIAISFNYSNRNIPKHQSTSGIYFPNLEYKINYNFVNKFSFKTGISLLYIGNNYKFYEYKNYSHIDSSLEVTKSTNTYLKIPFLFSYNLKNFYVNLGIIGGIRVFHSNTYSIKGGKESKLNFTYGFESNLGYYFPIKNRRMFVELSLIVSEFNKKLYLNSYNGGETNIYRIKYSQNIQLSIGYMFGKNKVDSKSNESKD
jgi:hypothetical protein